MLPNLKAKLQEKLNSDAHFAELVKGSGIAFVLRIFGIICGYIFTLLVTRTLGAKAWGIFALCLVVLQIASVIGRLGMDTALLRFTAEYTAKGEIGILKEIYKKALILVVPFSILVAISVYFLSPILADKVFHKIYLTNYFHIISFVIVPFVLLWIHSESIRGFKKIKEYMLLQQSGIFFIAMLLFLVGLSFIKSHFLPIISYSISIIILTIISIYFWRKYLLLLLSLNSFTTSTPSTTFTTSKTFTTSITYKSLLSVSIPMFLSSSLALIMGWTDTIMLGMFRSTQEVGIYNVVLRVSMITSINLIAVNTIAAPKFAEFWGRGDIKKLAKVAHQSTKLIFWTSFPILLLFLTFPKPILGIFGEEFKTGSVALVILCIGQVISSLSGDAGGFLKMTNNQMFLQGLNFSAVLLNGLFNYILIPTYGVVGAAIVTIISLNIAKLIANIRIKKLYGFWLYISF